MAQSHSLGVIDAEAAEWAVKVDAAPLSSTEELRLEAWLAADRRHQGAYARARAISRAAERLSPETSAIRRPVQVDRRALFVGGGAALAASVVGGLMVWNGRGSMTMATGLGETRRITLSDGTTAELDSASAVRATMRDPRQVDLRGGEAWMSVVADTSGPFLLTIGGLRASVPAAAEIVLRLRDDQARLTLLQGAAHVWSSDAGETSRRLLDAGMEASLPHSGALRAVRLPAAVLTRRVGWREGLLILDGETLAEAAREFNHYNTHQMEVSGAPAAIRVVGAFRNTDPQAFVETVGNLFDVRIHQSTNLTRID